MVSSFAQIAPALVARGYSPLPILPGSKAPGTDSLMKEWNRWCSEIPPPKFIAGWSGYPDCGVGVCLGRGLICIDIDQEEIVAPLLAILPTSPVQKKGKKGISAFYRGDTDKIRSRNYRTPEKVGLVDLLSEGKQTVLPPSLHPDTGEPYYYWTDDTLQDLFLSDLPELPDNIAEQIGQVLKAFGYDPDAEPRYEAHGEPVTPAGDHGVVVPFRKVNNLALANLAAWVPNLGLRRCYRVGGGFKAVAEWRASGSGRAFHLRKPNLSFRADGIRDFGDNQGYSPIDVVMKARGVSASESLDWLASLVGMQLHDPVAAALADRLIASSKRKKAQ